MSLRADIAGQEVRIAFPTHMTADFLPLLISELPELEAVFGAPVTFVDQAPAAGPRWIVDLQPGRPTNTLRWDAATTTLTSFVRDAAGLASTLQLLHSLVTLGVAEISDDTAEDLSTAIDRIGIELERGFPGFAIRGLQWRDIRANFPSANDISLEQAQAVVARLQDGHTAIRAMVSVYNPPYAVELANHRATLRRIPAWSAAAAAGVKPGWEVDLAEIDGWSARTGAPPHAHALVAGRRAIALNGVAERAFVAHGPNGENVRWIEQVRPFTLDELFESHVVAGSIVYVRLHNWIDGVGIEERFDQIITEHAHCQTMVIDLRGNTGGNLLLAKRMRRRFLRERTLLGTIQFTQGDGALAHPVQLWDDPAPQGCWPGKLEVLTDALTFSASEDFLHGLQGLPHVMVMGAPSGSGRPRSLPLIPGYGVTISTALTFDRTGHCIEGQGIPVDIEVDPFTEQWRNHLTRD